MRQVLKIGWWIVIVIVMIFMGETPAFSQSLFESSLSENHENLVSNSLSLGGFIVLLPISANTPDEKNQVPAECLWTGSASVRCKSR